MADFTVVGWKRGSRFYDEKSGQTTVYNQICLDSGDRLRMLNVRDEQKHLLDNVTPGMVLEPKDGFITEKYFIFL